MSVERNVTWRMGADWGFMIDCFAADKTTPIPITKAFFRMQSEEGVFLDINSDDDTALISFTGNRITCAIPRSARAGIINDVYDYVIRVRDAENTEDDQQHGTIAVVRSPFPELA